MKKAMIVTVGTGNTGEDIAGAILKSVKDANPERVLFVMTSGSEKRTYPFIQSNLPEKMKVEEKILPNPEDVNEIYKHCCLFIDGLVAAGYNTEDITIDYTSGTKAMSAGVVLAGVAKWVDTLSYVSGQRGDGGRVIPGTEKTLQITPKEVYGDYILKEVIELFSRYQYEAGLIMLQKGKVLHQEPAFQKRVTFLEMFGKTYMKWDRFLLNDAAANIHELIESSDCKEFLIRLEIVHQVSENKALLNKEKKDPFAIERACDLMENARRRFDEGKYDDAMARLYRFIEFLSQVILNRKRGLNSSNLNIQMLPSELREKYNKPNRFDRVQIGCFQCYGLLRDLKDPFGEIIEMEDVKTILEKRNYSILAHGFDTISKEDVKFALDFLLDTAQKYIPEMRGIQDKIKFPGFPSNTLEIIKRNVPTTAAIGSF